MTNPPTSSGGGISKGGGITVALALFATLAGLFYKNHTGGGGTTTPPITHDSTPVKPPTDTTTPLTLASITPTTVTQGKTATLVFTGTGFNAGSVVRAAESADSVGNGAVAAGGKTLTLVIAIPAQLPAGAFSVYVQNADGKRSEQRTITVVAPPPVVTPPPPPKDTVKPPPVITPPPPPPKDTTVVVVPPPPAGTDTIAAVHQFQCPTSSPEAISVDIYRYADLRVSHDTLFYPAAKVAPVIMCGPKSMVKIILAHPEAGHGDPAILAPPANTSTSYVVPSLTVQNGRLMAPSDTNAIAKAGLSNLVAAMINTAHTAGLTAQTASASTNLGIVEKDSTTPLAIQPLNQTESPRWIYYKPARGTRARTFEEETAGACWNGDPWTSCQANGGTQPETTATSWLATWSTIAPPPANRVLQLTAIITDGTTALPVGMKGPLP